MQAARTTAATSCAAAPLDEFPASQRKPDTDSPARDDRPLVRPRRTAPRQHARLLFQRRQPGTRTSPALQRELRRRQRAADVALLREFAPGSHPRTSSSRLARSIRSSLCGVALWWLDHPSVPRATVVDAVVRLTSGLVAGTVR